MPGKNKGRNILLILTDQQRFDTIEALGNPIIKTPALNQLVENGVSFTRAYTPCPVCVPARYSLHTGAMPFTTNCLNNEIMPAGRTSFMEILAASGYQTHGVGKMHFTFKDQGARTLWGFASRDFSEEHGVRYDFEEYLEKNGYAHVFDPQGVRSEMYYIPQPSQLPANLHNTTWVVDRSLDFLERRDQDRPFFLMTSFIKPHPPFESPTPWNKLYRGPEMPLPKRPQGSENLITFWNRFQNRYKYRDQGIDDNLVRCIKAAYYCAISFIDYNLGRLLSYLKASGLFRDTLILFASDHGEMLGDYNCFGKRCFLDSAARIPLLMVHPEITESVICSRPASLVDVMPTILQAAGLESGTGCCGESLLDLAKGKTSRETVWGQFDRNGGGTYMAVSERFKYIFSAPDDQEYLFDLTVDPAETHNKANNPMYAAAARHLKMTLVNHFKSIGYTDPLAGDDWKRYPVRKVPDDPDYGLLFQDPEKSIPQIPGYERIFQVEHSPLFKGISLNIK